MYCSISFSHKRHVLPASEACDRAKHSVKERRTLQLAELPDSCHDATSFDSVSRYLSLTGGRLVLNIC